MVQGNAFDNVVCIKGNIFRGLSESATVITMYYTVITCLVVPTLVVFNKDVSITNFVLLQRIEVPFSIHMDFVRISRLNPDFVKHKWLHIHRRRHSANNHPC